MGVFTLSNGHVFTDGNLPTVGKTRFVGVVSTDAISCLTLVVSNDEWVVQDLVLASPAQSAVGLVFPVRQDKDHQCGKGNCMARNAPINSVFDHDMAAAYQCQPGGYGTVTAFTGECGSILDTTLTTGRCMPLHGYKSATGVTFFSTI